MTVFCRIMFQYTAARRRLEFKQRFIVQDLVSTHSRPKAADGCAFLCCVMQRFQHTAARRRLFAVAVPLYPCLAVSTHSRPKAAAEFINKLANGERVSTHSRPKAADQKLKVTQLAARFNTQPPEGGWLQFVCSPACGIVSTHSRPKAAENQEPQSGLRGRFNTQPPEGGWGC